jgi:hypothetical protein
MGDGILVWQPHLHDIAIAAGPADGEPGISLQGRSYLFLLFFLCISSLHHQVGSIASSRTLRLIKAWVSGLKWVT